jgi:hypothetical protein
MSHEFPISAVSRMCGTHDPLRVGEAVAAVMFLLMDGAHAYARPIPRFHIPDVSECSSVTHHLRVEEKVNGGTLVCA